MGIGGRLGAPPGPAPGGGGNGGKAWFEPGRTGGGKGKLPGGGAAPGAAAAAAAAPGRAGKPGGGMPPGKGGKGMAPKFRAPGWFSGSNGLFWGWPSAA